VPYPIPAGASDHRLGGLGLANWAAEVQRQEAELDLFFDTIVVCTVTGSTQAGMIAGFAGQDRPRRVIGIDGSAKLAQTREQVARIARATAALIELGRDLADDGIAVLEGWAGNVAREARAGRHRTQRAVSGRLCRTRSTTASRAVHLDAIRLTARLEGMIIDPEYEGKSIAGLIDQVTTGEIARDSTVLYAHLGGSQRLQRAVRS
jgi:1-aminocyclopropane-1-carboxylate deaminase